MYGCVNYVTKYGGQSRFLYHIHMKVKFLNLCLPVAHAQREAVCSSLDVSSLWWNL
jgi:hypothetical protein